MTGEVVVDIVTTEVTGRIQEYASSTVTVYAVPPTKPDALAVPCPLPGAGDQE